MDVRKGSSRSLVLAAWLVSACSGSGSDAAGKSLGAADSGPRADAEPDAEDGGSEPDAAEDPAPPDAGDASELDAGPADGLDAGEVEAALDAGSDAEALPPCPTPQDVAVRATLRITADNTLDGVYFDGQPLEPAGALDSWPSLKTASVELVLDPAAEHVLALVATNTSSQAGLDRGVIGELVIEADGGVTSSIVTDGSWRATRSYDSSAWWYPGFSPSEWPLATELGAIGVAPWGGLGFADTTARWIWTYDPSLVPPQEHVNDEQIFLRKQVYIDLRGALTGTPACVPQNQL